MLIDLIHKSHKQSSFYNLSDIRNINYLRIDAEGIDDIKVSKETVENYLRKFL